MGRMVDGRWMNDEALGAYRDGRFQRAETTLRSWITTDGSAGVTGVGGFAGESGRYHLFVALNCPWAHRTLLARLFNQLTEHISVSIASPSRTPDGWVFDSEGRFADSLLGARALHGVYAEGADSYSGRVTVPVLWDKNMGVIVSNESSDIVRMFNSGFDGVAAPSSDFYPEGLRAEIEAVNERVYPSLNNGVYRAGFARTQQAYDEGFDAVFETLDWLESRLENSRFVAGDAMTEADFRLFPTLARFDVAYHSTFKYNLRQLIDYPQLWDYARALYQRPGVAETVEFDIYRRGYHSKSALRNPLGIIPRGPAIDWTVPSTRFR